MIKKIAEEPIKEKLHFLDTPFLTREEVTKALDLAVSQTEANLRYLNGKFPFSAAGSDDRYGKWRMDHRILDRHLMADVRVHRFGYL